MDGQKLFGSRIKELRKRANLTQEQLADKLGVFQKQIGNIETGTTFTTMPNLEKFANIFEVEVKDLFDFKHNINVQELRKGILQLLENAPDDKLPLIYRILNDILK